MASGFTKEELIAQYRETEERLGRQVGEERLPSWYLSMANEIERERIRYEEELMERGRNHFYKEQRGRVMGELLGEGKSMSELKVRLESEWGLKSKEERLEYSKQVLPDHLAGAYR
jgi:hypothetical protein